ncbi:hypothetical protein A5634_14695 [Mycobacterium asiaticum]|uniref:Uncharacterized protein n=2 Tax=Mycobacterium asiaticum TaxID=1790 RepID=A0A1A3PBP5_MYCAS|nr:hypothetical protein A5634_14695 [Mycobacterium asiaticum]
MADNSRGQSYGSPLQRAAQIGERVNELRRRRAELAAGTVPSPESVELARQRAADAANRADQAHQAVIARHKELARIHELIANIYQRAAIEGALEGADGSPQALQHKADQHWQAAHDSHLQIMEDEEQS